MFLQCRGSNKKRDEKKEKFETKTHETPKGPARAGKGRVAQGRRESLALIFSYCCIFLRATDAFKEKLLLFTAYKSCLPSRLSMHSSNRDIADPSHPLVVSGLARVSPTPHANRVRLAGTDGGSFETSNQPLAGLLDCVTWT
jgi:hypothetical protein